MSRSRRTHPFRADVVTASSEKQQKRSYNRRFRTAAEQALKANLTDESLPVLREYSDPWGMNKDGKVRFNPAKDPKSMPK